MMSDLKESKPISMIEVAKLYVDGKIRTEDYIRIDPEDLAGSVMRLFEETRVQSIHLPDQAYLGKCLFWLSIHPFYNELVYHLRDMELPLIKILRCSNLEILMCLLSNLHLIGQNLLTPDLVLLSAEKDFNDLPKVSVDPNSMTYTHLSAMEDAYKIILMTDPILTKLFTSLFALDHIKNPYEPICVGGISLVEECWALVKLHLEEDMTEAYQKLIKRDMKNMIEHQINDCEQHKSHIEFLTSILVNIPEQMYHWGNLKGTLYHGLKFSKFKEGGLGMTGGKYIPTWVHKLMK